MATEDVTAAQRDAMDTMLKAVLTRQQEMLALLERGTEAISALAEPPGSLVQWGLEVCCWLLKDQRSGQEMRRLMREHFSDEQLAEAQRAHEARS